MYDLQSQWNNNHQTDHNLVDVVSKNDNFLEIEDNSYGFGVPKHLNWRNGFLDHDPQTGLWMDE